MFTVLAIRPLEVYQAEYDGSRILMVRGDKSAGVILVFIVLLRYMRY